MPDIEADWTPAKKFVIGGLGGLLPILVSLLALNVADIIDNRHNLTFGEYCGAGLKAVILTFLGGTIAAVNTNVTNPLTLLQLGIAAPALVTSYINSAALRPDAGSTQVSFHLISTASADDFYVQSGILPAGFLEDVIRGATQPLGNLAIKERPSRPAAPSQRPFAITNRSSGDCFTTLASRNDEQSLRGSFPEPTYRIDAGACPRR